MTDSLPIIEGTSEPTSEPKARTERQEVLVQAKHMDMEVPQPATEVIPSRDIKEKRTEDEKLEQAEDAASDNLSTKNEANLPKAKKNTAVVKKRTKVSTPIGNEAPSYLVDLSNKVNLFYDEFKQVHLMMQNMEKKVAHEAPLQQNQVVQPSRKRNMEVPSFTNDRVEIRDDREKFPLDAGEWQYLQQHVKRLKQQDNESDQNMRNLEQFKRRNQAAMDTVIYQNQNMEDRSRNDPTVGHRASSRSSGLYW